MLSPKLQKLLTLRLNYMFKTLFPSRSSRLIGALTMVVVRAVESVLDFDDLLSRDLDDKAIDLVDNHPDWPHRHAKRNDCMVIAPTPIVDGDPPTAVDETDGQ